LCAKLRRNIEDSFVFEYAALRELVIQKRKRAWCSSSNISGSYSCIRIN